MGIDQGEVRRRRKVDAPKYSTKYPIAAIEKRVIDSESFAALPPSAIVVLLLLARNLEKGRNGHIFLAAGDAARHGINERTLYRQLKTLQTHGFVVQTLRGGNGRCSRYAVTWLPLSKDTKGLYLDHFEPAAWRHWKPPERRNATARMSGGIGQEYRSAPKLPDKEAASLPDKNTDVEVNTNSDSNWISSELARLEANGLAGHCCFQIPRERTVQ